VIIIPTIDPLDAVQVGLRTLLLGDAALTALIGESSVWDEPPEDEDFPYVHIGEATSILDGTHSGQGRQVAETLHSWDKARTARSVNRIGARLVAVLDLQAEAFDAVTSGVTVWMIRHEFSQTLRDPDRTIRHRIDRFRIYTSQEV
jgi:hypothetical protein